MSMLIQDRHQTLIDHSICVEQQVEKKPFLARAGYKLYSTGAGRLRNVYVTTPKSGKDDLTKATIAYRQHIYQKRRRPTKQAARKKKARVRGKKT